MPAKLDAKANGLKEIRQFLGELPGRVEALKRHVVSEVAGAFLSTLQSKAPASDADLGTYAKEMKLAQVTDGKYPAYAVIFHGSVIKIRDLDPEKVVLYVNPKGGAKSVYSVLAPFQPFDVGLFPLTVPVSKVMLIARRVSPGEITATRKKNMTDKPALDRAIAASKVRLAAPDRYSFNEVDVLPDAAFIVLRKELGLGTARKPHWRPSLRIVAAGAIFKGIVASKTVDRLMSGRYRGYDKLGMLSLKVTDKEMKTTKAFQEKILGES